MQNRYFPGKQFTGLQISKLNNSESEFNYTFTNNKIKC